MSRPSRARGGYGTVVVLGLLGALVFWLSGLTGNTAGEDAEELARLRAGDGVQVTGTMTGSRERQQASRRTMVTVHCAVYTFATRDAGSSSFTSDVDGMEVNLCVGYGGRQELADAVRSLLREQSEQGRTIDEVAEVLDVEHIADHLYTKGQPDPDLVIRTSGEQRLGGFLLWQSAHSEFYFCEAYWPDFRRVDFLRALRSYAARERRLGR